MNKKLFLPKKIVIIPAVRLKKAKQPVLRQRSKRVGHLPSKLDNFCVDVLSKHRSKYLESFTLIFLNDNNSNLLFYFKLIHFLSFIL